MVDMFAQQGADLSHGLYDHVRFAAASCTVQAPVGDEAHVG